MAGGASMTAFSAVVRICLEIDTAVVAEVGGTGGAVGDALTCFADEAFFASCSAGAAVLRIGLKVFADAVTFRFTGGAAANAFIAFFPA